MHIKIQIKGIHFLIIGVLIPIVFGGLVVFGITSSVPDNVWSYENRHMLDESYSPKKTNKLGVYDYDSGVFGYTSVQVSISKASEQYPISGNLLRNQAIDSVKWVSENTVEFSMVKKSKIKTKIIATIE